MQRADAAALRCNELLYRLLLTNFYGVRPAILQFSGKTKTILHTSLGMTRDELSGIPFTLFVIRFSKVRSSFAELSAP